MARKKAEYVVLASSGGLTCEVVASDLKGTVDALRWVKEHGEAGFVYRVAALTTPALRVKAETVEKRSLVPQEVTEE